MEKLEKPIQNVVIIGRAKKIMTAHRKAIIFDMKYASENDLKRRLPKK